MHIFNQSSMYDLNPKTNFEVGSATFTSLKAAGTRLLKPLKHETRAKDIALHYLALTHNLQNASLVYWRNGTVGVGFDRLSRTGWPLLSIQHS